MEANQKSLGQKLNMVDTDLGFLFLLVAAVLLSFWATVRERDALCLTIQGDTAQAARVGKVGRIRLAVGALVAGSLGFFFMQALETWQRTGPEDETACRSARLNLIASFLVLLAALIRLFDLNMLRRAQPALDDTLPPL